MPSPSRSRSCGSGGKTLKFVDGKTSRQSRSGGNDRMHTHPNMKNHSFDQVLMDSEEPKPGSRPTLLPEIFSEICLPLSIAASISLI